MNNNDNNTQGFLTVKVSTARGAIPLSGAVVNIRGGQTESSTILYSLISDNDGKTKVVSLPTPPMENSESPVGDKAYATYNIDVFKEGYLPLYFNNVPVFPSVISVQPAVMIPATSVNTSDGGYVTERPSDIE